MSMSQVNEASRKSGRERKLKNKDADDEIGEDKGPVIKILYCDGVDKEDYMGNLKPANKVGEDTYVLIDSSKLSKGMSCYWLWEENEYYAATIIKVPPKKRTATNNAALTKTKSAAAPTKTKSEEPKTKKPKMLNVGQSNLKSSEQAFMNRLEAKTSSLAANIVEINTPSPTTSTSFRDENTPLPASNALAILKQTHQIMSQFPDSHSAILDHNQLQQSTPTKSPASSPKISPSPTRKAISPFLSPLKEFAEPHNLLLKFQQEEI